MDRIEWVLVRKDLLESFPEINPSNYDHDDACELNRWGAELVTSAAPPPPVEVLRMERDHARACYERTVAVLTGIHAVIYPEIVKLSDGRKFAFNSPHIHEQMQALSDRIRAIPSEVATLSQRRVAPGVARLVKAATTLRQRQRAYLEQPKGERDESKGQLVGDAARELDEALAPFIAAQPQGDEP